MSQQKDGAGRDDQFVLENEADRSRIPVGESIKVGRDSSCGLVLASEKGSRLHADLKVTDGALWVEDRKSTNGTFVNKQKITEPTRLEDGDVVQFGDVRFRVIAPSTGKEEEVDQGTVMVGEQTMLHIVGDEEAPEAGEPAKATGKSGPDEGAETAAKSGTAASDAPATAGRKADDAAKKASGKKAPAKKASGKKAPAKKAPAGGGDRPAGPEEPEAPSIEGRAGGDPSIPRSWADADQLEAASHTAFVARPDKAASGGESGGLDPLKAIAQARRSIPAEVAVLVGLTEPVRGKPFKLSHKGGTEKWEMGRGKGADIDIEDESVSGRHAQLICEGGRWKVVNMMSVNGTFVNERKVLSAYLSPRDVIRMGVVELVFDARIRKRGSSAEPRDAAADRASGGGNIMARIAAHAGNLWHKVVGLIRRKQ